MNTESYFNTTVAMNIAQIGDEEELRNLAWRVGAYFEEMSLAEQSSILNILLDKSETMSSISRCFVLDNLLAYIEIMTPERQCHLLRSYLLLENCSCCPSCCRKRPDLERSSSALLRRVSPKAQNVLQQFLQISVLDAKEDIRQENNQVFNIKKEHSTSVDKICVALVVPEFLSASSFLQPPIDMLMAAARLRKAGYEVQLVDNRVERLPNPLLAEKIDQADAVVVTTTPYDHIQNYFLDYRLRHALNTVNVIKQRKPERKVIICGAHGTVRPDLVFTDTEADIILQWEYDHQLVSVMDVLQQESVLRKIPNVCLRSEGGVAIFSGRKYMQSELDDGIMPAYDLIQIDKYYGDVYHKNRLKRKGKWSIILASRGCRHSCMFCFNFWGQNLRYRDPKSVVDELEFLQLQGVEEVFFIDFHFTQDKQWVSQFCMQYRVRGLRINWSAQVRCDTVPYNLLREMAAAGCNSLWFGVESFNTCIVRASGKYSDSGVAIKALKDCLKAGIQPHQFIMIGLPGETKETINQTISQIHNLKMPYTESVLIATPRFGTSYYEMAKRQFPSLGQDFYSLNSVRGIVGNEIMPIDLQNASLIFRNREFIYTPEIPQLK